MAVLVCARSMGSAAAAIGYRFGDALLGIQLRDYHNIVSGGMHLI